MALTLLWTSLTPTTAYTGNRKKVSVSSGPIGFLTKYALDGVNSPHTTSIDLRFDVSPFDSPDETDDTQWFTPSDQAGGAVNTVSLTAGSASTAMDFTSRRNTTSHGITFTGITTGIRWLRVSVKTTGGPGTSAISLWIQHNPGTSY